MRELNNYHALGAIIAGVNGTAVHRLAVTRELISPVIARDFMKLEILMSSQKSYFAYRLAWDNSSGERIPYLPLHRRDLVSAAEGNATFADDRTNAGSNIAAHPGTAVYMGPAGGRAGGREAPPCGVDPKSRINWRKFEVMGEVIVGIQQAQGTPYTNLRLNEDVRILIMDFRFVKDDDVSF